MTLLHLIRKDFIVLRWYFLFVAVFALIFGWNFRTSISPLLIQALPTVMMVMLTASIEFRSKSMMFVSALPVSRKQIVLAKYVSVFFYCMLGLVLMIAVHAANVYITGQSTAVSGYSMLLAFGVSMLFAAIYLFIQFWLGIRSSQVMVFAAILLLNLFLGMASDAMEKLSDVFWFNVPLAAGIPLAGLLIMYSSYRWSLHIFRRKDIQG